MSSRTVLVMAMAAACLVPAAALADAASTRGDFTIRSEDGAFEANLGGRVMLDGYAFDNDTDGAMTSANTSGFQFRRMRLESKGRLHGWGYKVEVDFGNEGVAFKDVYMDTRLGGATLKIGQFKAPFSLEELTSSRYMTFLERSYIANAPITPAHQIGLGLGGKGEAWTWDTMAYSLDDADNGVAEGLGIGVRLTLAPFSRAGRILHLGVAAGQDKFGLDSGAGTGDAAAPDVQVRYRQALRSDDSRHTLVDFAANDNVDLTKVGLEVATVLGPFWASSEFANAVFSSKTSLQKDQSITTYYLQAGIFLTGESRPYQGGRFDRVKPKRGGGAVEVALRYDFAENGERPASNAGSCNGTFKCEVASLTAGINWHVNANVRFMLDWVDSTFSVGGQDDEDVSAIATRAQIDW